MCPYFLHLQVFHFHFVKLELSFHQLVDDQFSAGKILLVLGDFKVNLLNYNAFAAKLKSDLHLSQLINESTRITKKSATLIDRIYCSCKLLVRLCGVANIHLSNHCLIFCELSNEQTVSQKKFTYYRRIHRVNKEQFTIDFHALPWSLLETAGNADVAIDIFKKLFFDVWDLHTSIKKRPVQSSQCKHWISSDLLKSYSRRDNLYKRFIKTRTSDAWMAYHQARNCCTAKTHTAKWVFFLSARDKPSLFWSNLKTCTGLGKQCQASLFWPNSTPILSKASANMINNSFLARVASFQQPNCSTISHLETSAVIFHADSDVSSPLAVDCNFSFVLVSQADVIKLINDLPLSGATGSEAISTSMLKFSAAEVTPILAKLFTIFISMGTFPPQWKTAIVTPIFKKGNRADITNYRPISILSPISRIFEHLIDKQLRTFIEDNAILSRHQHGFHRHHSCLMALLS